MDDCFRVRGYCNFWALGGAAFVPDLQKGGICPPMAQCTAMVRCLTAVDVLKFGRQNFLSMFGSDTAFRSRVQETMHRYRT